MSVEEKQLDTVRCCIALIEQHHKPHLLSTGITFVAVSIMLYMAIVNSLSPYWLVTLVGIVILGLLEIKYAVRIGFDILLLRQLSNQTGNIDAGLNGIDHALMKLQLIPTDKSGKPLDTRLEGCLRLFKVQTGLCVVQIIVLVGAVTLHIAIQ